MAKKDDTSKKGGPEYVPTKRQCPVCNGEQYVDDLEHAITTWSSDGKKATITYPRVPCKRCGASGEVPG